MIGHQKDSTSDYLTQFPQWEREEVKNHKNIKYKSAWDKAPYTPMFITVDAVARGEYCLFFCEKKCHLFLWGMKEAKVCMREIKNNIFS